MKTDFLTKCGFTYIKNMLSCSSPYGDELIKKLAPLENKALIDAELKNAALAKAALCDANKTDAINSLSHYFMCIKNIRRSINNIGETTLDEVELFEVKRFLIQLREIKTAYEKCDFGFTGIEFSDVSDALKILCIDDNCNISFYISDNYSEALKEIRRQKRSLELKIRTAVEPELSELKRQRLIIADKEDTEEANVRAKLTKELVPYKNMLLSAIQSIAHTDLLLAKAQIALKYNTVMPKISDSSSDSMKLSFTDMINPAVSDSLEAKNRTFIPVTLSACSGSTVITGANMGGKSIALKTVALNCYLALCGMFVFAKEAVVPYLDNIAIIDEDGEDMKNGLSSFGSEILMIGDELKNTDGCSLILFDEIARGTNPQEGAKIMRALVKYLNSKKAICILTTHYDGVARYAKKHYRVMGLKDFDFSSVKGREGAEAIAANMNYGLYEAGTDDECPKEAIGICRMLLEGEPLLDVLLNEDN